MQMANPVTPTDDEETLVACAALVGLAINVPDLPPAGARKTTQEIESVELHCAAPAKAAFQSRR